MTNREPITARSADPIRLPPSRRRRPTLRGHGFCPPGQGGAPYRTYDLDREGRFRVGSAWVDGDGMVPAILEPECSGRRQTFLSTAFAAPAAGSVRPDVGDRADR